MQARLRSIRFWLLALPMAWIVMVFVAVALWPEPGAASSDELASEVTNALRAHDFHKLKPLLAVGGEDVAKSTTDQFQTARVDRGVYRDGAIVVEYTRDGTRAEFRLPVEVRDDRYVVNPVITPSG